jgi:hypothetical protein
MDTVGKPKRYRGKYNKELMHDIKGVLRKHKVHHIMNKMSDLKGAGWFDTIKNIASKGMDFYNKNKTTIDNLANVAVKNAPAVIDLVKKARGGKKIGGAMPLNWDTKITKTSPYTKTSAVVPSNPVSSVGGGMMAVMMTTSKRRPKVVHSDTTPQVFAKHQRTGHKRPLPPALRAMIDRAKAYAAENGVSYKQALIALKGR